MADIWGGLLTTIEKIGNSSLPNQLQEDFLALITNFSGLAKLACWLILACLCGLGAASILLFFAVPALTVGGVSSALGLALVPCMRFAIAPRRRKRGTSSVTNTRTLSVTRKTTLARRRRLL